jgi:hypothetical protein
MTVAGLAGGNSPEAISMRWPSVVSRETRPLFSDAVDMTSGPGNRTHSRQ